MQALSNKNKILDMLPRTPMPAVVEHAEVQAQAQFPSRSLEVEAWIVTAQAGAEAG